MSSYVDVLVVGGGVAGAVAAAAAARRGARVLLCHAHAPQSALGSGPVEVAALAVVGPGAPAGDDTASRVEALAAREPWHPYARIGADGRAQLSRALALLTELAGDVELVASEVPGRPLLLADVDGRLRCADLAPRAQARGELHALDGQRWGLVGFEGLAVHDGRYATAQLRQAEPLARRGLRPQLHPLRVDFFRRARDAQLVDLDAARLLDDDVAVDALARALGQSLRAGSALDGVLVPPLIGLHRHREALFRLQALAGLPVAEMASGVPSVPGLRLMLALQASLQRTGVEVVQQRVEALHCGDREGICAHLAAGGGLAEVRCRGAVLATGAWDAAAARVAADGVEPVSGAPLCVDGVRVGSAGQAALSRARAAPGHPLGRTGIHTDGALRPLNAPRGAPLHPRLHAAGAVLAGNDRRLHGAGLGLCALTGLLAGEAAGGPGDG